MCGIAAIFNHSSAEPVEREELVRIRDYMIKRGPDGHGEWFGFNGRVGFGHRRLSIIDLSDAGAQPMETPDGRYVITFNGEIYNFQYLRRGLERKGYQFRSNTDTEVLLHLYAEFGEEMVKYLRGMFAFAIWDEPRKGLFLARDHFGIKPLYYSDDGQGFRCASQVKALLQSAHVNKEMEPAGHVGFFIWGHVPEPWTLYQGIRALEAGHSLWVDQDGVRDPQEYFSITKLYAAAEQGQLDSYRFPLPLNGADSASREVVVANTANSDVKNPGAQHAALRAALVDTVKHHLIADVPVGVFLSAGIDSSTLVALASEQQTKLTTVTLGFAEFKGTENDETVLAQEVAKTYGTQHHTVWISKNDFRGHFESLLSAMDQPSIDGVNTYFVSWAAKQAGLKVALSGLGGDELFGGYPSFRQIPRSVSLLKVFNRFPELSRTIREFAAPMVGRFTSGKYASLLEYGGSYGSAYLLRRALSLPWQINGNLTPDLFREGLSRLDTFSMLEKSIHQIDSRHCRVSALESSWFMRNQLLRDCDWAGMDHSLEIRTPLVDAELFRCVASLRTRRGPTKRDIAASTRQPLPAHVLDRRKTGFSVPVREWLLERRPGGWSERGLHGWANLLYHHFQNG